jgi:hypothetical protein
MEKTTDITEIIESNEGLYWSEKQNNFVKLCFSFSPEFDTYMEDFKFLYDKITKKVLLDNYNIFCINKEAKKQTIKVEETPLTLEGIVKVLLLKTKVITMNEIEQQFIKKKCDFHKKKFYSPQFADLQRCLPAGSIIIINSGSVPHSQLREYNSCPVDPKNLAIYCIDIYGDNVESIEWLK